MADQMGKPGVKEEAKIPVFAVLKKGSILKNIFLNNPPPELGLPGGSPREPCREEEKVLIGRHPDCHIVLDHPSISRFHLEIRVRPSSQKLAVVDLSSVHGTWVSGNKIEPRVPVDLAEGDTVRLGASTRVYELHWVPVSCAFEWDNPLPALPEEQEQTHQAENGIPVIDHFSFESWANQIPSAPPMPQSLNSALLSLPPLVSENLNPGVGALEETVISSILSPEILSSSSPLLGQENGIPESDSSPRSPGPSRSEKWVTSSLLSRRSKSISFLRIHTGRSREKLGTPGFDVGKQEENGVVFKQVRKEEALCKVLFSALDVQEDVGEEAFLSDKENMTPEESRSRAPRKNQMDLQRALNIGAALDEKDGFFSDKENCTPQVPQAIRHVCKGAEISIKYGTRGEEMYASDKENMTPQVSHSPTVQKNQMELQRSLSIGAALDEKEDGFFSDKENCTPQVPQAIRQMCKGAESSIKSGKQGEETHVSDKENMTPQVSHSRILHKNQMDLQRSLNVYAALDEKETGFSPEKENCTPQVPQAIRQVCKGAESSIKSGTWGEETYVSDKENMTPQVSHSRILQKNQMDLQRSLNIDVALDEKENGFFSDKENCTPHVPQAVRQVSKGDDNSTKSRRQGEEETFVSDKENQKTTVSGDPATKNYLSTSRRRIEGEIMKKRVDRVPFQSLFENSVGKNSPLSDRIPFKSASKSSAAAANVSPASSKVGKNSPLVGRIPFQSLGEKSSSKNSASAANVSPASRNLGKNSPLVGRIPFQPLREKSASKDSASTANVSPANSNLVTHPQKSVSKSNNISVSADQVHHKAEVTKKWYIIAETSCFLNEESRKSLQLLEGLRGTHLIIPRMVIRELDCLRRRESYFRKTPKASSALQWIEECMVKTSWWIHVQSSMESMPVAPTPPASPRVQLCEGNSESHGFISNSMLFSKCGSLAEILSPTAEDHILDCALLFKKIKSDGQLVLLTSEVSLKIKAMAEGLLCESPKEFRQSLVNPFSQRFLWAESSPRGPTWSCSDQVGENGNYHNHCPTMKKTTKAAEGARGLKLILLHNSQYAQANLIRNF